MRSITTFDLQYAHRFYGFQGEAQYLHGHTGVLTIEVEDTVNEGVNMVYPCNEIQKVAWDVLKNFDHALVLREDEGRSVQNSARHRVSRLPFGGDQGNHDCGRHD